MSPLRIKALALASISAAAIAALSGCDLNENADVANGRLLFTTNCGICHTLAEAGTTATIGPNLDAAFAAARNSGQDQDTFEGVISAQIENPRTADPSEPTYMPAHIVEGQEASDVATYVASVAGVPGIKTDIVPGGPGAQVFSSSCGSCHTLAAAGTAGTLGPNLDEVLPGQSEAEIKTDIVDPSAAIAQGFQDIMPKDFGTSIEPGDLTALVKFLADSAGKTKGAPGTSATP